MTTGNVLDPTAVREDDISSPGPDAGPLAGKTVGFHGAAISDELLV